MIIYFQHCGCPKSSVQSTSFERISNNRHILFNKCDCTILYPIHLTFIFPSISRLVGYIAIGRDQVSDRTCFGSFAVATIFATNTPAISNQPMPFHPFTIIIYTRIAFTTQSAVCILRIRISRLANTFASNKI